MGPSGVALKINRTVRILSADSTVFICAFDKVDKPIQFGTSEKPNKNEGKHNYCTLTNLVRYLPETATTKQKNFRQKTNL